MTISYNPDYKYFIQNIVKYPKIQIEYSITNGINYPFRKKIHRSVYRSVDLYVLFRGGPLWNGAMKKDANP